MKRTPLKRKKGMSAHPKQQAKVRGLPCARCGWEGDNYNPIDAAHVVPRSWVACECPDGVIPLCRRCHRLYDEESVDILPQLEARHYHREMGHAVSEHSVSLLTVLRYVTGEDIGRGER